MSFGAMKAQCNWSGTQGLWGWKSARSSRTSVWQSMQWKCTHELRFQSVGQQKLVYLTRSWTQTFMLTFWTTFLCHSSQPNSLMVTASCRITTQAYQPTSQSLLESSRDHLVAYTSEQCGHKPNWACVGWTQYIARRVKHLNESELVKDTTIFWSLTTCRKCCLRLKQRKAVSWAKNLLIITTLFITYYFILSTSQYIWWLRILVYNNDTWYNSTIHCSCIKL